MWNFKEFICIYTFMSTTFLQKYNDIFYSQNTIIWRNILVFICSNLHLFMYNNLYLFMYKNIHLSKYSDVIYFWNIIKRPQVANSGLNFLQFHSCRTVKRQYILPSHRALFRWALLVQAACSECIGNTDISDFILWILLPSHDLLQARFHNIFIKCIVN